MPPEIIGIVLLAFAVKLLTLFICKKRNATREEKRLLGFAPIIKKALVSDNEKEFFNRLQRALPNYHIFPQVAANAILKVGAAKSRQMHYATHGRFSQKYVDFVVCERESLNVLAIIELDDKTHNAEKDKKRDTLFEEAGYRVIRYASRNKPTESRIVADVAKLIYGDVLAGITETLPDKPASIEISNDESVKLPPAKNENVW